MICFIFTRGRESLQLLFVQSLAQIRLLIVLSDCLFLSRGFTVSPTLQLLSKFGEDSPFIVTDA